MQIINSSWEKPFLTNPNHLKLSTQRELNNFLTQVHTVNVQLFKYIPMCASCTCVKIGCRLKYADSEYCKINGSRELILVPTYAKE